MKIPLEKLIKLPERKKLPHSKESFESVEGGGVLSIAALRNSFKHLENEGFHQEVRWWNNCLDSLPKEVEIVINKDKLQEVIMDWHRDGHVGFMTDPSFKSKESLIDAIIKALPELIKGD